MSIFRTQILSFPFDGGKSIQFTRGWVFPLRQLGLNKNVPLNLKEVCNVVVMRYSSRSICYIEIKDLKDKYDQIQPPNNAV